MQETVTYQCQYLDQYHFAIFYLFRHIYQSRVTIIKPSKFFQATKPSWKQLELLRSNSHDDDR